MLGELQEDARRRDGVRPPRQSHEDAAAGRQEIVPANCAAYLLLKGGQLPNPNSQFPNAITLGLGVGFLGVDLPEGRLELPTPRL